MQGTVREDLSALLQQELDYFRQVDSVLWQGGPRDAAIPASLESSAVEDVRYYICWIAAREAPVRLEQVRVINDVLGSAMTPFDVMRIGTRFDAMDVEGILSRPVPDSLRYIIYRDLAYAPNNVIRRESWAERWVHLLRMFGTAVVQSTAGSTKSAQGLDAYNGKLESFLDVHLRPYLARETEEGTVVAAQKKLQGGALRAVPSEMPEVISFLQGNNLERLWRATRIMRRMLAEIDLAAISGEVETVLCPRGTVQALFVRDMLRYYAWLMDTGSLDITPDRIRFVSAMTGDDVAPGVLRISSEDAGFPGSMPRSLEALTELGQIFSASGHPRSARAVEHLRSQLFELLEESGTRFLALGAPTGAMRAHAAFCTRVKERSGWCLR